MPVWLRKYISFSLAISNNKPLIHLSCFPKMKNRNNKGKGKPNFYQVLSLGKLLLLWGKITKAMF